MIPREHSVFICVPAGETAGALRREIHSRLPGAVIHSCAGVAELHAALCRISPDVIVLDESVLIGRDIEACLPRWRNPRRSR